MRALEKAEQLRQHSTQLPQPLLPNQLFWQRLSLYLSASHSLFFRAPALKNLFRDLSEELNASRIHRSFHSLLLQRNWPRYEKLPHDWSRFLDKLHKKIPFISFEHLRAFLNLQLGHHSPQLSAHFIDQKPSSKQEVLLQIWLGHSAFWAQKFQKAQRHYLNALSALKRHPHWLKRSSSNWRLPAERLTTLYHLALIQLQFGSLNAASRFFRQLRKLLRQQNKRLAHASLWYQTTLWLALLAQRQKKLKLSQQYLTETLQFREDRRLQQFLFARTLPQRSQRLAIFKNLQKEGKSHRHSYPDTPKMALFWEAQELLQAGDFEKGLTSLYRLLKSLHKRSPTPSMTILFAVDTRFIRFLPLQPAAYRKMKQLLHPFIAHIPQKPLLSTSTATTLPAQQKALWILAQRLLWMQRELSLLEALAEMKLGALNHAEQILNALNPKKEWIYHYLALIALERWQYRKAHQLWQRAFRFHPHPLFRFYLILTALLSQQLDKAQKLLSTSRDIPKLWKPAYRELQRWLRAKRKRLPSSFSKKLLFKDLLGSNGWLATFDPYLRRTARGWRWIATQKKIDFWYHLLPSLHVSEQRRRLSLTSFLLKFSKLAIYHENRHHPHLAKEYQRRRKALAHLFRAIPEASYLLERTLYSYHWGTLGISFR